MGRWYERTSAIVNAHYLFLFFDIFKGRCIRKREGIVFFLIRRGDLKTVQ